MLVRESHLRYVSSVTSPYSPAGVKQISANRQIAFATVNFTQQSSNISATEATQMVNLARAPNSSALQVDVVGAIAASTNPSSSSSTIIGVVAALIILLIVFGSILPVQWGWLGRLFGVTNTGPISPFVPILMFAVLFGLTTDYEVFLVSRIHEEWLKRRDNSPAVRMGQAVAGRTILAAASIMTAVFFAFTFTTDRTIKMIGLGMAAAIVVDALVVRAVLVPAVMHSLAKGNWYLPKILDRRLPHLRLEDDTAISPAIDGEPEDSAKEPSLALV